MQDLIGCKDSFTGIQSPHDPIFKAASPTRHALFLLETEYSMKVERKYGVESWRWFGNQAVENKLHSPTPSQRLHASKAPGEPVVTMRTGKRIDRNGASF